MLLAFRIVEEAQSQEKQLQQLEKQESKCGCYCRIGFLRGKGRLCARVKLIPKCTNKNI